MLARWRAPSSCAAAEGSRRRARAEWRLRELLARRLLRHVEHRVLGAGELDRVLDRIAVREEDPYSVVDDILGRTLHLGTLHLGTLHLGTLAPSHPGTLRTSL